MNKARQEFLNFGVAQLPKEFVEFTRTVSGENGEILDADEAGVWKRVLDYRVASYMQPNLIVETHSGKLIASELYKIASPKSTLLSLTHYQSQIKDISDNSIDFVDIDPYGLPYDTIDYIKPKLASKCVICITNGEIVQITRKLKGVHLKSNFSGKDNWKWVEEIYIPYLEKELDAKVQFYYIFPTSVRCILSRGIELPDELFAGCKKYMWWIEKYAHKEVKHLL